MRSLLTKLLGALQIFGGLTGFLLIILQNTTQLIKTSHQSGLSNIHFTTNIMIPFVFLILYLMCVRAGFGLYRDQEKGYRLSKFLQILQIPTIITKNFTYLFVVTFGANLGVIFKSQQTAFNFQWVSMSHSLLNFSGTPLDLQAYYINFIPIIFILLLLYCKTLPQEESLS